MAQALITESPQTIENELYLLEALAITPETTQADLAVRVGIAVGTVNWYLKRWTQKGYIKVQRIDRWQWRYLLTPEGVARKGQLARDYIDASFALYRRIRHDARRLLTEICRHDLAQVGLMGEGEIMEICRLTCLELQIQVVELPLTEQNAMDHQQIDLPILWVEGLELQLIWPHPLPRSNPDLMK